MIFSNDVECMKRDHPLFIGGYDEDGDGAVGLAYAQSAAEIGRFVDPEAGPGEPLADPAAHIGVVLSDASGEYEGVEPSERGDEAARLARDPPAEEFDCFFSLGAAVVRQRAHVT